MQATRSPPFLARLQFEQRTNFIYFIYLLLQIDSKVFLVWCLRCEKNIIYSYKFVGLVATGDVARNPLLEQAMTAGEHLTKVLRLLCLSSVVGGGLPAPAYQRYRAMLLDVRLFFSFLFFLLFLFVTVRNP